MRTRHVEPEVMDDPSLDRGRHRRALRALSRLNRVSGSARIVWSAVRDLAPPAGADPLRVLDVATGGGDVPVALARFARRARRAVKIDACDISPVAIEHARARADKAMADVDLFPLNALADPLPTGYDVITCSLFLHHLDDACAERLLRKMAASARRRVVVNDLRRGRLPLAMVYLVTRLVTRCRVVHTDGPRSVRAALTVEEAADLARRAGLTGAMVRRRLGCRYLLTWDRA